MSAASRARRLRPDIEVVVFERGGDVSYAACMLPYFIAGVVGGRGDLIHYDAEFFRRERHIDVRLRTTVTSIDPVGRSVTFRDESGQEGRLPFDALVLGTGAHAVKPPLPGIDIPGVETLRGFPDGERIKERVDRGGVHRAAVIGGGFIGLEMAEAFRARGAEVTVIELLPALLPTFDPDMTERIERELMDNGVSIRKETRVTGFEPRDGSSDLGYVVANGQRLECDLALVSVGVRPSVGLASEAGIQLGPTGAIKVDARQVTSEPSVLAAGDCAEATHVVTGRPTWVPLGTTANRQGKLAGENAVGGSAQFGGVAGTNITKVFNLGVAQTGLTDQAAEREGFSAAAVKIRSRSRHPAYPGADPVDVKLAFEPEGGRLLGGQIVGTGDAAKRIDTVAAALFAGMTVGELAAVDTSYAPPFSPVWDPVIMAAVQAMKKVRS
jgi:NADPH-dependent 2,4-dienoyl-CoA reductase/sulfur reductase-like enzyme